MLRRIMTESIKQNVTLHEYIGKLFQPIGLLADVLLNHKVHHTKANEADFYLVSTIHLVR